jgi:hypothetical protein
MGMAILRKTSVARTFVLVALAGGLVYTTLAWKKGESHACALLLA